jgi:hypothetical protein
MEAEKDERKDRSIMAQHLGSQIFDLGAVLGWKRTICFPPFFSDSKPKQMM